MIRENSREITTTLFRETSIKSIHWNLIGWSIEMPQNTLFHPVLLAGTEWHQNTAARHNWRVFTLTYERFSIEFR